MSTCETYHRCRRFVMGFATSSTHLRAEFALLAAQDRDAATVVRIQAEAERSARAFLETAHRRTTTETREELRMPILQLTRFKSDKAEEMISIAKQAKAIFEKHGAEFLRLSRFHTGVWAGEWLVSTRYSSWEVYGKVQEAVAKDPAFAKLMAHTNTVAQLMGRNIAVGIDL
jgi:hypothetical protein